jgi:hypothetical protein
LFIYFHLKVENLRKEPARFDPQVGAFWESGWLFSTTSMKFEAKTDPNHPQGGWFWEREWVVLGKSQFANPLKNKGYLAFSAPYIPFKYIF